MADFELVAAEENLVVEPIAGNVHSSSKREFWDYDKYGLPFYKACYANVALLFPSKKVDPTFRRQKELLGWENVASRMAELGE